MEKFFSTSLNLWRHQGSYNAADKPHEGVVRELREQDIPTITKAHRDEKLIKSRFDAGYPAYWLEIDGECGHIIWFATGKYFLWDLRCDLLLPSNGLYLFDSFTPRKFRRMQLGQSCVYGTLELRKETATTTLYVLVRLDNKAANSICQSIGYDLLGVVSLLQLVPFRRYKMAPADGEVQRLFRVMGIRTKPAVLDFENLKFTK